jgi:hypothetical protein
LLQAAGYMLYLFSEGAHFRRFKGRLLILEKALRGTIAPLVGRYGLGGRAYLVLLVSKFAYDRLARYKQDGRLLRPGSPAP